MQAKRWQAVTVAGLLLAVLLAGALLLRARSAPALPEQGGSGTLYYTGPMQSKGHPGVWADASGQIVAPPPDAAKPESKTKPADANKANP